ncbi:transmembrane protein, putative, partial [Rhizoctonia solani AG-3 Rhs1AP]
MSALVGGLGNPKRVKSRTSEGTDKDNSTSNEDSSSDETNSTSRLAQPIESPEIGNPPINQKTNVDVDTRHDIPEYSSIGSTQSEEYGLGKESRFWKTYVKEADRWDEELVDGWNKSLDVLLVFAALFSAIVTAFIVESSNLLQEDPADVSAQTLLIISQTLMALANDTQPIGLPSSTTDTPFSPSRSAVAVNALWYLSLSLSVSTSFLAILAKEWCHSFITGRTGHPCLQARRRQKKWTMLERWKMRELILVLPSLMHLSLLLFAIGICIYVWDISPVVAIPVICVCGMVIAFYLQAGSDDQDEPTQDMVTSQAISWMITNCEVPRSVDVTLQAIAGANKQLPREPLERCNAALVISRRLGSGDLYTKAETKLVSLYIRALFVLGSDPEPTADSHKDELEIMIRDLQTGSKKQVMNLITDGNFTPNSQNLEALQIGSNAPHQCLVLVKDPNNAGPLPLLQVVRLLQDHLNDSKPLHPAALLSLVNAVAMIASCAPSNGASNPAHIIMQLIHSILSTPPSNKPTLFEMSGVLAACALSQGQSTTSPELTQLDRLARTEQSLRALADYMQGKISSEIVFWSGVLELSSHPDAYGLDTASESEWLLFAPDSSPTEASMIDNLHNYATVAFSDVVDKLFSPADVDTELLEQYVENVHRAYRTAQVQTAPAQVHVFLLECLSHGNVQDDLPKKCSLVLSQLSFPRLSLDLVRWLSDRDIIPKLRDAGKRWPDEIRFSATCHLWLLFTLYLDTPEQLPVLREQMLAELEKYNPVQDERAEPEKIRQSLGRRIENIWRWPHRNRLVVDEFGTFAYRFMECLFEQQERPKSDPRWKQINKGLVGVPQELRGLSSFVGAESRKDEEAHVTLDVQAGNLDSKP